MENRKSTNAWIIYLDKSGEIDGLFYNCLLDSSNFPEVEEGDGLVFIEGESIIGIGRVYSKYREKEKTKIGFDGLEYLSLPLSDVPDLSIIKDEFPVKRLTWDLFEKILDNSTFKRWDQFPVIKGENPKERAHIRELLQLSIKRDLLGPADGPTEEILGMSVRDRYLVGKLAPMSRSEGIADLVDKQHESDSDEEAGQVPDDMVPYVNPDHISRDKVSSSAENDGEDKGVDASTHQSLAPSSLGFTFCVESTVDKLELVANWGCYERKPDLDRKKEREKKNKETGKIETIVEKIKCWKRIPYGGSAILSLDECIIEPIVMDDRCPEVIIQGSVSSPLDKGDRLISLFLINNRSIPDKNQDESWVFQPELIVRDPEKKPIFIRRPVLDSDGSDAERESLEMIYRKQVEFAVGHGVSVHATTAESNTERAVEIRTSILPEYEVPITETPGLTDEDRPAMKRMIAEGFLDMENLAVLDKETLVAGLKILTEDYALWITELKKRIGNDVIGYDGAAASAIVRCSQVLERLREGIETLGTDEHALEAFRFANKAMALQRIRSIYALTKRRGEDPDIDALNVGKNRSWRPFQLAFILLSLPALADPEHKDRTEPIEAYTDLLWFPTGGGKTEAYLGVAAFTMAIRRLQGNLGGLDGRRGLAVIMRYTLRLLTIQQFQRATTLICALESMRREDPEKWGTAPFTIGLWVGNRVTPGNTEEAHRAIQNFRNGRRYGSNSPAQLTTCPWCGAEIAEGRDIEVMKDVGRTVIYCGDKHGRCEFSKKRSKGIGIPAIVVDDEIYRHPPSMLIATVDKFALMAWRGQIRTLFGHAEQECIRHGLLWPGANCTGNHAKKGNLPKVAVKNISPIRPPDLILQDELHLISGPLGTMVGLYETAIDELSTWKIGTKAIRPKVIASTATVRKSEEQVNNVFLRKVLVFPPHGLDVEDNFFSIQRSIKDNPGRRYIGICSPGSSRPAVLIRVYVAMLTSAQALFERFGEAADPYMTVVGYFNSLRELGGMRRLSEDDVQTRSYRVKMSDVSRPGLEQRSVRNVEELTSRVSSKDIPKKLDQLEVKFNATLEDGKYISKWKKGETRAIDIVLATNMLSVGVDIGRLGTMAVNGQPKNTAEYIQATSRIGRLFPGLICTVLTWSKPRDLSHYETFEHYHATFYKHVEAQSVTPFAPRALDRGLTGMMVSMMRLKYERLNPNLGAMRLDNVTSSELAEAKEIIMNRAWKVKNTKSTKTEVENMISDRADRWVKESNKTGRRLGYETEKRKGDVAPLLKKPGVTAWNEFTVPMSMREVEPGVKLIMDDGSLSEPPMWRTRKTGNDDGGEA